MRKPIFIALATYMVGLTLTGALAEPATAQGWIDPVRPTPDFGVVKLRTTVSVRVTGRVARVEVEEHFQNRGPALGEGDYLYPLPGEAVFSNFSLYQGDQELRGETMDANRARSIYEEIVRAKRDPALIELAGHGLVRARVFPIAAGETRKITLRYTQLLNRAGDALQFRYAAGARNVMMNRPRGVDGRIAEDGNSRPRDGAPLTFTLTIDNGSEFRNAFSPTHEVRNERSDGHLIVRPSSELNGDFALFLPLATNAVGITVVTHRPSSEPGYFMLTLSPGQVQAATAVPRDITAVIDVSGSMSGEKMQQARSALRQLLETLTPRDRFRLIAFSNDVRSFRPEWTAASETQLREARRWVDGLIAEGGTNIAGALDEAFHDQPGEGRLGIAIFLTDGIPSVGEQNPERIAQRAEQQRGSLRVFAFGVGYDVNTYLLDRLSAVSRGATQYVQPGENVEQAVATLAAKVRHPVLSDLRIGDLPVRVTEVYPRELPDLFAGEDLVLFGRYAGENRDEGAVTIVGRRGGNPERFQARAAFPARENGNDFIPRLWASRKLGELTRQLKLNGNNPEIVEEIRTTALRYGLLSEYTSYLVQEPTAVVAQDRRRGMVGAAVGAAAPPPAASAVGQAAVQSSTRTQMSREVRSHDQLEESQKAIANSAFKDEAGGAQTVAGRHFRQDQNVWKDAMQVRQRIVNVEQFSPAYFALLQRLPELEPYWKTFDQVLVAGKTVSIQIAKGGTRLIDAADIEKIAADFRGR